MQRLSVLSAFGAVLAVFAFPARADGPLRLPSAASLGFAERQYLDSTGRTVSEYRDKLTGYVTTIRRGPDPVAREETVLNSGGGLIYHAEIRRDWRRLEGALPAPWSIEIRALPGGQALITEERRAPDGHYETSERVAGPKSWSQCEDPRPVSSTALDMLLQNSTELVTLIPDPFEAGQSVVHLGSNCVAKNCGGFGRAGPVDLARTMQKALDTGLRCLANLGKTHPGPLAPLWRAHVAQLLGYFSPSAARPFTVVCERTNGPSGSSGASGQSGAPAGPSSGSGSSGASVVQRYRDHISKESSGTAAQALPLADLRSGLTFGSDPADFPGMALNLNGPGMNDENNVEATIFHEMLHHLGYLHGGPPDKVFDAVYGAEFCCFPSALKDQGLSNFECDQITSNGHGAATK